VIFGVRCRRDLSPIASETRTRAVDPAAARQNVLVRFRVSLDGQPPGAAHGVDADAGGNGTVMEPRLYQLIRQKPPIVPRQIEIEFLDAGVEAFAFTFG
jgi:hypothetical protein